MARQGKNSFKEVFRPVDLVIITYQVVMSIVAIVFLSRSGSGGMNIVRHGLSLAAIVALRMLAYRFGGTALGLLSDWYPILTLPFTYKSTGDYIHAVFPGTIDSQLYALDAWLLGTDPARFIQSLQTPLRSDVLQLAYCSFFAIIFFSCYILYRNGKMYAFSNVRMAIVAILYGTYLVFLVLPAHGPRFEYREFFRLNGGLVTHTVNSFIGGAAYCGGAFPSGHAAVSLAVCAALRRYQRDWLPVFAAVTLLLLAATVYGGYHYIVDLIAGALFGAAVAYAALRWNRSWHRRHGTTAAPAAAPGAPGR
ncbi:MAG: phosphatase PAP2 family protein [Candidatus Edwardsbacteria bacterium]|nr:phosphatase PAP2 family protein [Candidatus Edwardsbacteria bacterium]